MEKLTLPPTAKKNTLCPSLRTKAGSSAAAPLTLPCPRRRTGPRGSPNGGAEEHGCPRHSTHGHQPTPIQAAREKKQTAAPTSVFQSPPSILQQRPGEHWL